MLLFYPHFQFVAFFYPIHFSWRVCLPVDTAVHRCGVLMWRMRMEILLLVLVQLLQLSVPFHLCGGGDGSGTGLWRRCSGGVEAGPRRLRLRLGGRRRGRAGSRRWRLRRALFDVVVLAQDPIVMQVETVSDTEPDTHTTDSGLRLSSGYHDTI